MVKKEQSFDEQQADVEISGETLHPCRERQSVTREEYFSNLKLRITNFEILEIAIS